MGLARLVAGKYYDNYFVHKINCNRQTAVGVTEYDYYHQTCFRALGTSLHISVVRVWVGSPGAQHDGC